MAKKNVTRIAKLQFKAGQAKPGPELAGLGIDMAGFTREFNDATRDRMGEIVPAVITAYDDRSYEFILKTTPAAFLIKRAAGVEKGSATPNASNVGTVTVDQLREIAEYKMEDLNTASIDSAISMMVGTAKSLGIVVEGDDSTIATDVIVEKTEDDSWLEDSASSGTNSTDSASAEADKKDTEAAEAAADKKEKESVNK